MFVSDERVTDDQQFFHILESSLKGGATIIQLREKMMSTNRFYERALAAKAVCSRHQVPLIINDRVDIALAVDADGVHIGQTDLPVAVVRDLLGADKIVGWSVSNEEQAVIANDLAVDYIGLSPIFHTGTKTEDLDPPLGIDGLKKLKSISNKPIVCIGGVTKENTSDVIKYGADGIAVVSAISQAADPAKATNQLKEIICQVGTKR